MTRPTLVVMSRDAQLMSELPQAFGGRFEIRGCDGPDETQDLLRTIMPHGLVADFRRTPAAGHLEDRWLTMFRERFPLAPIAILTGDDCPEALARRASEQGLTHLRGRIDLSALVAAFRGLLVDEPEPQRSLPRTDTSELLVAPQLNEDSALGALSGMTRRFETNSPQLTQMLQDLEVAARHDVTILLIGETGAGKTYLSRLIHEVSQRRHEPFLPVACGALPSELIESELFGHVKGAFTSAHQDKEGKFIAARRGSILLDEIDVLGLEQQVKLLRVIETGEFEPVGSNQTFRCQARLIAASNLELQPLVEQNRFRPDLYYRLNMLKFTIPPLRSRKMDIVPLAKKFIRQFALKHAVKIREVDPSLFQGLLAYPWPGNVRELEHVMQRAVIYCRDGVLGAHHLPGHILGGVVGPTNDPSVSLGMPMGMSNKSGEDHTLTGKIALTEREIIEQALFRNSFSRTRTAKELGISRVTLYNKMKRYGIQT